ncbi:hypothetical protein LTR10_016242 [Elasticomyces elasticus]|uniref:Ubiquitin-like domain-containing protein n=1 Tax=Exophiala sideris TaxID=1016849 RepID=A0ABR0JN79_9EURO|nr:hypothetical protein LTR10_016242 [Elasticomyces elasticus]KAK5037926.1 hypothetical protein LTS07_001393 [Exophiala sideris]KAK5043909.1 hypothetical protein LTR13_000263 [Exophiala sideris]KAK5067408.1 hypothetical protein LTR69_001395 [Exophiala sideris]KAK5182741.1 hypothetical protein LTR44_005132 [Eurotiomycetes sp. CCFEE 6388]
MGDLQFAKQFLTSLDNKPTKYQPDQVFDPKTYQMRIPYTLPKLSNPPHPEPPKTKPLQAPAPGSQSANPTITLSLKSARNPNMTLTIPSVDPNTTTIQALKEQTQSHLGGSTVVQADKIKILYNKKPIPPSKKTVAEALDGLVPSGDVEFGVMVMGGAPDPPPQAPAEMAAAPESEKAAVEAEGQTAESTAIEGVETTQPESEPVQPGGSSGEQVLQTSEFWDDLQGFLEQRIRDQAEAVKLRGVFEKAWRSSTSAP